MSIDSVEMVQVEDAADVGVRNGTARAVDVMGLAESTKSISKVIEDHVYSVMIGVRRAHSLLRVVNARFEELGTDMSPDQVSEIQDLIETAMAILPHHYEDLYDPVEESLGRLRKEHDEQVKVANATNDVVRAMAAAARPDVTGAELEGHAHSVYMLSLKNETYTNDWQVLLDAIKARGFMVLSNGIDRGPSILSSETVNTTVRHLIDDFLTTPEGDGSGGGCLSAAGRRRKGVKGKMHAV
ncbi:MAG: hypothetical protein C0607_14930 [Azoarcus sp.]|nr:MAG: hypothetical protein C0607_14930 [Azoarcus sp.]